MFTAKDRRAIPYKKTVIHPSLWSDPGKVIDVKEFPVRDLSRNTKRAAMDQTLSDLYTTNKLKKWAGERKDGAIWPGSMFAIVKNGKVFRAKISNAWAGCDKEDVDDKIDQGKKVEVCLVDEGHSVELVRKKMLYKISSDYSDKTVKTFSKLLTLQLKQPYPLSSAEMNKHFTALVKYADGIVFAKPISKAPKQGGGERNVVELYLPPSNYSERKSESFSDLSNLTNINELVRLPKKFEEFMDAIHSDEENNRPETPDEWDE